MRTDSALASNILWQLFIWRRRPDLNSQAGAGGGNRGIVGDQLMCPPPSSHMALLVTAPQFTMCLRRVHCTQVLHEGHEVTKQDLSLMLVNRFSIRGR